MRQKMRISKIEFENFRNFRDYGCIECSTDGKATIIYGKNGDGKTTLHQLLQWIFYGRVNFNKTTTNILYNMNFEAEAEPGSDFEVWGRIHFTHANVKYSIRRTAFYKKSLLGETSLASDDELELLRQDENLDWKTMKNPKEAIEMLLPSGLADYFFFDGESMIADLRVKGADSAKKLRLALYSMFDLDIYNMAAEHIGDTEHKETVLGKLYLSKGEACSNSEVSILRANIENIQTTIESVRNKIQDAKDEKREKQSTINRISEQIGSTRSRADYEKIRHTYESQRDNNLRYLDTFKQNFGDEIVSNYPSLLMAKAINDARMKINLKVEKAHLPSGITKALIEYLLAEGNDYCICGNPLCKESREKLLELANLLPPKSYASLYHDFILKAKSWGDKYDRSKLETLIQSAINAVEQVENSEEAIREADAVQRKSTDIGDLVATRQLAEARVSELDDIITRLDVELRKDEALHRKYRKQYEEMVTENEKVEIVNKKISIMNKVLSYFKERLDNASVSYSQKLQVNIQSLLNRMLTSEREVSVSNEFAIKVYDSHNDESKSEGQFAVVSFAYIGGIMKMLGSEPSLKDKEYPLILDGPFSKLDEDQRQNVIDTIPHFAPQVILFSKDSLEDLFRPENKGRTWTIQSNAEKNIATVKEGYLWN